MVAYDSQGVAGSVTLDDEVGQCGLQDSRHVAHTIDRPDTDWFPGPDRRRTMPRWRPPSRP